VSAPEDTLAPIPPGTPFEAAAAVPLAALTAWQCLEPRMPLEGKRVLVHAGAGGVGSFAIQVGGGRWGRGAGGGAGAAGPALARAPARARAGPPAGRL
jgi:NADPH-dependent curcumin reductase CurA